MPYFIIPIALLLVGILLIIVEVYLVPGFNVVGVLGALLILLAVGYSFTQSGFQGGVLMLAGALVVLAGVLYVMKQSGAWDRFVLSTNLRRDEMTVARESEQRSRYLGKTGVALSPLRPTGIVDIDGERIEVATEGDYIAAGSRIKVVAMDRRRYFVRLDVSAESEPVT